MSALTASLARVTRIFLDNFDACEDGLIVDKSEQLSERPRVDHAADLGGSLASLANASEPFDVKHATGFSNEIHDLPADPVIHLSCPPRFSTLRSLDHADLAFLLECLTIAEVAAPNISERLAVEELHEIGTGQDGDIGDPEIKTKMWLLIFNRRNILAINDEH